MTEESFSDKAICRNCLYFNKGLCQLNANISTPIKDMKVDENSSCANWDESLVDEIGDAKFLLRQNYERIIKVLRKYCDIKEEYYPIVALWIIGTYCHKEFTTFPYLFFNAMKGSGKSRILKLILHLCHEGKMVNNLSEAVLFRTASQRTLGIDEFEQVHSKEKSILRELLNSAYKKGTVVERAIKSNSKDGEKWKIESYDVYCPIIMANIGGMEEVLSDRCISLILDKSGKRHITRLLELYDIDKDILEIKRTFSVVSVVSLVDSKNKGQGWNDYVMLLYDNNNNYTSTLTTQTTLNDTDIELYQKIDKSGIDSRNLELFFPIFLIAKSIGTDVLDTCINVAKDIVSQKKDDDWMENRDVNFINFIANSETLLKNISGDKGFIRESDILHQYRIWAEYNDKEDEWRWLNSKWIGRALKRLNFVLEKKRLSHGIMVHINFDKVKKQATLFKEVVSEEKV